MFTFLQAYRGVPGPLLPFAMMIIGFLFLIPIIFYLITLQNTLKAIAPENRTMDLGMVWLNLIPLFGWVWHFIIVNRMADSIQAQLNKSDIKVSDRPGHGIGIAMCILFCTVWIPVINFFTGIAALVCWIIYWVKISEFKKKIESSHYVEDNDSMIFGSKNY